MKIEVSDDHLDILIKAWLKDCVEMSENLSDDSFPEDIKFWKKMGEKCRWILHHNWPGQD